MQGTVSARRRIYPASFHLGSALFVIGLSQANTTLKIIGIVIVVFTRLVKNVDESRGFQPRPDRSRDT